MVGGPNATNSPTRKRPRSQSGLMKRARPTGLQRPPIPSQLSRPPEMPPPSRMRSFADMVGTGASLAEAALGDDAPDDAWDVLQNTVENLGSASVAPAVLDRDLSRSVLDVQEDVPIGIGDALAPGEALVSDLFEFVPVDLSIKTKLRIVSSSPLQWTICRSQGEEYKAVKHLASGKGGDTKSQTENGVNGKKSGSQLNGDALYADKSKDDRSVSNAKLQFGEALLHFRYPSAPLAAIISSQWQALIATQTLPSRGRVRGDVRTLAIQRLTTWQSALQSLYFGYRHGHIKAFYVLLSTSTVVFNCGFSDGPKNLDKEISQGEGKLSQSSSAKSPRACFSRGTAGLRSLLSEYAVPFKLVDGTAVDQEPCVVVEGEFAIHALYNFMFSAGPRLANATDVPILLCDQPFRGCIFAGAEVQNVRKTKLAEDQKSKTPFRYSVHLSGLFTPRQISGLCEALLATQSRDFSVYMETDPKGSRLNICGHGSKDPEEVLHTKQETAMNDYDDALRGSVVLSRVEMSSTSEGYAIVTKSSE